MAKKPRFTEEQYRYARDEANALDYAMRHGYDLVRKGNCYQLREHDSMVFTQDGRWFWNSRSLKGRALEFLQHYEGKSLPEAVLTLCHESQKIFSSPEQNRLSTPVKTTPEKKPFVLPAKAKDNRRLFAYLCATRKLDREIVSSLVRKGDIYESARLVPATTTGEQMEVHNAVFVGRDANGIAKNAFQRGLTTLGGHTTFRRDVAGSDPSAPFCLAGNKNTNTVLVFEAAIDAISHASLLKSAGLDYRNCDRIALGGTQKGIGLLSYLDCHPNIQKIVLAMDEDDAGQKAKEALKKLIPADKYTISEIHQNLGKDWNDYLKVWHEILESTDAQVSSGQVCHLDDRNVIKAINFFDDPAEYRNTVALCLRAGKKIVAKPPNTTPASNQQRSHTNQPETRSPSSGSKPPPVHSFARSTPTDAQILAAAMQMLPSAAAMEETDLEL